MFPRFQLWGRSQTYSPEQAPGHSSSDQPLVLLVVSIRLESVTLMVNHKVMDAHKYYVGLHLHS
jgi:hypothetical protein